MKKLLFLINPISGQKNVAPKLFEIIDVAFGVIVVGSEGKACGARGEVVEATPHHRRNNHALAGRVEHECLLFPAIVEGEAETATDGTYHFPAAAVGMLAAHRGGGGAIYPEYPGGLER